MDSKKFIHIFCLINNHSCEMDILFIFRGTKISDYTFEFDLYLIPT